MYRGGASLRYRLRLGDFPLANVPFPLAAKAASPAPSPFRLIDSDG